MRLGLFRHAFVTLSGLGLSTAALASVTYIAKKGDTLSEISSQFVPGRLWGKNGSVPRVVALNPGIQDPNLIFPGQKIFLPADESLAKREPSHRAKSAKRKPAGVDTEPLGAAKPNPSLVSAETAKPAQDSAKPVLSSQDDSATSLEMTPFLGMTTLTSKDLGSGTQDSLASSVDAGLDARYIQSWNESFKTFERGRLNYVSFSKPTNSVGSVDSASKLLTTIGFGAEEVLSPRLRLSESFDLEQNLFIRAASSTSITTDSILIPTLGAQVSYDLVRLNAFVLAFSLNYSEKMKASTNAYTVGLGSEVGGIIEVRQRKRGEDLFAVDLGTSYRSQDTSLTTQSETAYTLSLRFFLPVSKSGKDEDGGK